MAVNGQVCTVPGSLNHSKISIDEHRTYVLAGYILQCEGIVTTWEFCYQMQNISATPSVTFYPSIWESSRTTYLLIQSNTVTFTPNGDRFSCQNYTLPVTERFMAPSGSVVGLYSNTGPIRPLLLRSDFTHGKIKTYQAVDVVLTCLLTPFVNNIDR